MVLIAKKLSPILPKNTVLRAITGSRRNEVCDDRWTVLSHLLTLQMTAGPAGRTYATATTSAVFAFVFATSPHSHHHRPHQRYCIRHNLIPNNSPASSCQQPTQ
ncbi:hypothetical protein PM082_000890 [Marasmius tenuissimus]|nr:hypothetical protein PM082_000890 [Marasmius tenuissimus]